MNDIVERLEQDCYCSDLNGGECVPCQARTEIERLRTDYELLSSDYKELLGDNERLRAIAYSYPPTEFAPEGVTWQQEAEKLRGLLRWWLTAGGADEDTIREVLGE